MFPCQVERDKYTCGVRWLHNVLYGLQFTSERVSVVATKMVNDVARYIYRALFLVYDVIIDC